MNQINSRGYFVFLILIFLGIIRAYTQEPNTFSKEISLSSANDAYVIWQNSDRFYSYGVGINLKFKKEKLLGLQSFFQKKTDFFFEIGLRLEGYTPTDKVVTLMEIQQNSIVFDRPYAGLLFGTLSSTYTFERSFVKGGFLLGVLGPSSLAGNFQDWFHDSITNDPVFEEWKFQAPNQLTLNFNASYVYDFTPQLKWFDVYGMMESRLGNLYIDAAPTLGFRLGKFNKLTESIGMDNNILSNSPRIELFLQTSLSGSLNVFDATAQGNLFNNNFEFAVDKLNTFSSTLTQSVYFSSRRFALGIEYYVAFGKVVQKEQHAYARTIFKYKF